MRLLIVAPKVVHRPGVFYLFPVGLAYVSASLKAAGFEVTCLNTNYSPLSQDEQVRETVQRLEPDAVLCGGLSVDFTAVKGIFSAVRICSPNIMLIAGGGLVSSLPEISLSGLDADYGIIGEGELTAVDLLEALRDSMDPSRVEGIVYRDYHGTIRLNPARLPIPHLDVLPFPDFAGFDVETYLDWQLPNSTFSTFPTDNPRSLPLVASRSCPFQCSFCYHPLGNHYRQRSLENIFAEIETLQSAYGINGITIYDELFAHHKNRKRVHEFCDFMRGRGIHWQVSLRVDCVDDKLLTEIRKSGCYHICYGLESANNSVLESMGKKITVEQIDRAIQITAENRIGIQGNFIFGDNREDLYTAHETIDWWRKHLQYQIHLVMVETYPGSALYQRALANGIIKDEMDYLAKGKFQINNSRLTKAEYESLQSEIQALQQDLLIIPAKVLEAVVQEVDELQRRLYRFKLCCPHCEAVLDYENICDHEFTNYSIHPHLHKLCCRNCRMRFDIPIFHNEEGTKAAVA